MITREQKAEIYSQPKVWIKNELMGWVTGEPHDCAPLNTNSWGVRLEDDTVMFGSEYSLTEPKPEIEPWTVCKTRNNFFAVVVYRAKGGVYKTSCGEFWTDPEPILIDGKPMIIPEDQRPK